MFVIEPEPRPSRGSRLRTFLALPAESIGDYLTPEEQLLHMDAPALNAFVVEELPTIAVTLVVGLAVGGWGASTGNLAIAGAALIAGGSVLLYLQAKRWSQQYTAYILTSARVMRISGVFRRSAAWIPWAKVTDVRFDATFMGRLLGYATVYIDSANETSGLSEMRNLRDPRAFHVMLTELVQLKQGYLPLAGSALVDE